MNERPPSSTPRATGAENDSLLTSTLQSWMRSLRRVGNGDSSARDTLEELIEEREEAELPINEEERLLLANILELRGRTVHDVMVPRANIVGVESDAPLSEIIDIIAKEGHSRLPIYRETLDDSTSMIHAKDILTWRGADEDFSLSKIQREVLFVSPSMEVLALLLEMRVTRSHMALVVDEFGGVDGLVTIEDLVEEIVGEIEDEHDRGAEPELQRREDGGFDADAHVTIETLEDEIGEIVSDEEREEVDTLGGLVFALAGRIPIRGELIKHPSGVEFEVVDADPRKIKRLRLLGPLPTTLDPGDSK